MKPNQGDILCENFWIGSRNQIPTISQLLWLGLLSYGTDSNTNSLYQSLLVRIFLNSDIWVNSTPGCFIFSQRSKGLLESMGSGAKPKEFPSKTLKLLWKEKRIGGQGDHDEEKN
jgi:hypothetical protein